MTKPWSLMLALLLSGAAAQAQTVWRCGADGRSYSDSPCPDGRPVAVADARSAAEVAQGLAVLARDQRLAQRLAAEARDRERQALARGGGPAAGLTGMQATGHSCTHCGSSKWPTHSVHLPGSIS